MTKENQPTRILQVLELKTSKLDAFWNFLFGAILVAIALAMFQILDASSTLISIAVGLYGLWNVFYGLYLFSDQRVLLRIDHQGIQGERLQGQLIPWNDMHTSHVYYKTSGIRTAHHIKLISNNGSESDAQISHLDFRVGEILIVINQFMKQAGNSVQTPVE